MIPNQKEYEIFAWAKPDFIYVVTLPVLHLFSSSVLHIFSKWKLNSAKNTP